MSKGQDKRRETKKQKKPKAIYKVWAVIIFV
jgi:hypothetical protein